MEKTSKPLTEKEVENKNIKEICKKYLEKHLDGRKFNKEKSQKWGENIINDIENELIKKYPGFGFGIFFYFSERTDYNCNSYAIYYLDSDNNLVQEYNSNDFYSEIRVFQNKKYSKFDNFLGNINGDTISKINQTLVDNLEGRTYKLDKCTNYVINIVKDVNDILLKRSDKKPCSYHICFINQLPITGFYFTYKFINLEYIPLFFNYSNDSLSSRLYLFIVNN